MAGRPTPPPHLGKKDAAIIKRLAYHGDEERAFDEAYGTTKRYDVAHKIETVIDLMADQEVAEFFELYKKFLETSPSVDVSQLMRRNKDLFNRAADSGKTSDALKVMQEYAKMTGMDKRGLGANEADRPRLVFMRPNDRTGWDDIENSETAQGIVKRRSKKRYDIRNMSFDEDEIKEDETVEAAAARYAGD